MIVKSLLFHILEPYYEKMKVYAKNSSLFWLLLVQWKRNPLFRKLLLTPALILCFSLMSGAALASTPVSTNPTSTSTSPTPASTAIFNTLMAGGSVTVGASDYTGTTGYMGDSLQANPNTFAELSDPASSLNFTALGGLPYITPLLITEIGRAHV